MSALLFYFKDYLPFLTDVTVEVVVGLIVVALVGLVGAAVALDLDVAIQTYLYIDIILSTFY